MGNAQEKPPGSAGGQGFKSDQPPAGSWTRGWGGGSMEKPQAQRAPEKKGVANGTQREESPARGRGEQSSPAAVETSYLDAPAGALPPHLARFKNEGNHLFKHGQFGEALGKYSQAIDGCNEAGREAQCSLFPHSDQQNKILVLLI